MAIENGLMPMKNLWLLSSIILLFFSQMTLLCMSSCTEETLVWIRADLQPLRRLGREMQSQRHHFIVGYAVVGLPDLPLRQDGLVRVWNHWLWAAQQDDQQSCCQQQESAPLTCRGQAHHSWESQMFVPTQKNMLLSQFLNCSDNYSFNIGTLDWSSYCWLWSWLWSWLDQSLHGFGQELSQKILNTAYVCITVTLYLFYFFCPNNGCNLASLTSFLLGYDLDLNC